MKRAIVLLLAALAAVGFAVTLYWIFYRAPMQREPLYFNQKIFYYHIGCAFMLFAAVFTCGIASLLYLKGRRGRFDDVATAGGELAVLFGSAMLVSGSIWAKVAWGHWWVWDARLTTSLLLWMVMVGYVLVRRFGGPGSERLAAGLGVFGMVDVPLIYYSVRIWRTYHPSTSTAPGLRGDMLIAMLFSVLLFVCVFVVLLVYRAGVARCARLIDETREAALDAGLIE
ncbi:MAG TPA: cytochrome c biogenesis protein CcsA [Kofleriaceae bacterium]|nr:cytochrome c biogenesis protein CcsA [Kofleriaceae bacterium]